MITLRIQKTLQAAQGEMLLDVDLKIKRGQFVTLYGPSGAGKTSTLRILSGLLRPEQGQIIVNQQNWLDTQQKIDVAPQQRKIGYVFQDYALFPNMTVLQNLEFALGKNNDRSILPELVDIIELGELQNRYPTTLSGGQKQRVALARALVQQPDILLLDEPLSALDQKIRSKLQDYLLRVHRQYQLTTILISHNIGEIYKLSDWVFVLEDGQVQQQGPPHTVFSNQQLSSKFKFTGEVLRIEQEEVVAVITVLIQNQVVKVVAIPSEITDLVVGDQVLVASKAFNPVIYKLG